MYSTNLQKWAKTQTFIDCKRDTKTWYFNVCFFM